MADPLSLLRLYYINKKEIVPRDDMICFGEYCWPKDVKTNYKIYSSSRDGPNKSYYTLECLLYFLKNVKLQHPTYVKQAASEEIPVVQRPDRKDLLAYLSGESGVSTAIDRSAPIELPINISQLKQQQEPDVNASAVGMKRPAGEEETAVPSKLARLDELAKVRKQISERHDASKSQGTLENSALVGDEDPENATSIRDALSREEIAALKAKRLAKKRSTIIDADQEFDVNQTSTGTSVPSMLIQYDKTFNREIQAKERVWRNRSTILQSAGHDFQKTIFPMLARLNREEGQKSKTGTVNGLTKGALAPTANPGQLAPQQYNRYDQERFQKGDDLGFRIDTTSTYHGLTLKSVTEGNVAPRPLSSVTNNNTSTSATKGAPPSSKPAKRVSRTPIIIIPATNTSLITMHNAKAILQDYNYEDSNVAEARESEVLIQRRKADNTTVPYRIIDNPTKLTEDEWNRVVAVFVQGPTWQFKGWPWNGNPVEIFSKIKAFHVKFDEMKLDPNVAKWSVEIINLSRNKRYLDRANLLKFWSLLDQFIKKHKHNVVRY